MASSRERLRRGTAGPQQQVVAAVLVAIVAVFGLSGSACRSGGKVANDVAPEVAKELPGIGGDTARQWTEQRQREQRQRENADRFSRTYR